MVENYRRTLQALETFKLDIWHFPHNETYHYEIKLTRSAKEGVKDLVDPEDYKSWLAAQRKEFETTVNKES